MVFHQRQPQANHFLPTCAAYDSSSTNADLHDAATAASLTAFHSSKNVGSLHGLQALNAQLHAGSVIGLGTPALLQTQCTRYPHRKRCAWALADAVCPIEYAPGLYRLLALRLQLAEQLTVRTAGWTVSTPPAAVRAGAQPLLQVKDSQGKITKAWHLNEILQGLGQ